MNAPNEQHPTIYKQLAAYQSGDACETHELHRELHRLARVFISTFDLDIDQFVIGIGRLRRTRLGQFRYGSNDLGLRAEITMSESYVRECVKSGDVWRLLGTLLHELLHGWQEKHGKPGRRNYHNKAFRRKAMELGLIIDDRGYTQYQPGSPFFDVIEQEGFTVPVLPEPKFYQPNKKAGKSKLNLWICCCDPPQRARVGRQEFLALCPRCNCNFEEK